MHPFVPSAARGARRGLVLALASASLVVAVGGWWAAGDASAAPPEPAAEAPCRGDLGSAAAAAVSVQDAFAALRAIWRDQLPGPAGERHRDRRLAALRRDRLHPLGFAERVLAVVWDDATGAERARWQGLLGRMLEARYLARIGDPGRTQLVVHAARSEVRCRDVQVVATLERRRGSGAVRSELLLRLVPGETGYRAVDVSVDGVGLAATWARRFARRYGEPGDDPAARAAGAAAVRTELERLMARYPEPGPAVGPRGAVRR